MRKNKLERYYQNNCLYRSRTMMTPEMQEKVLHTCQDCIFFITVIGKKENKSVCVQTIPIYSQQTKKISREISIYEILKYITPRQLLDLIWESSKYKIACEHFIKRTQA